MPHRLRHGGRRGWKNALESWMSDEKGHEESGRSDLLRGVRPEMIGLWVSFTVVGVGIGVCLFPEAWAPWRKVLAGAALGLGSALILFFNRVIAPSSGEYGE